MKIYLLIFVVFFWVSSWGQSISGVVKDSSTLEPLPYASIYLDNGNTVVTDRNGQFQLSTFPSSGSLTIDYIGYLPKKISYGKNRDFYIAALRKISETPETPDGIKALDIVEKAILFKEANNPEKKLHSYSFKTYSKVLVTADPDSINPAIDSVFVKKNGEIMLKELDSTNFILKDQLSRAHIYMGERAATFKFSQKKGRQENILGLRTAGFKEPLYEVLELQLQSFSFYDPVYTLLDKEYTNPLSIVGPKIYDYKLLDILPGDGQSAYLIHYYPKDPMDPTALEGVFYIDTASFALQKAVAEVTANFTIAASQTFSYYPKEDVWFPISKKVKISKGKSEGSISFLGNKINKLRRVLDSTETHSNPQYAPNLVFMISEDQNFDIKLNTSVKIDRKGLAIKIEEGAQNKQESFWDTYREEDMTVREMQTYIYKDSLNASANLETKLNRSKKLLQGYYPTKFFDFDLRYLLKYNNYEAFRLGLGAITNNRFSEKLVLNGYLVYGTQDKKWKYSVGATTRLNEDNGTWLGITYTDDLVESGSSKYSTDKRTFYLFEPRLFNISSFYAVKSTAVFLEHDLTPKLSGRLQVSKTFADPTFDYSYLYNGATYTSYDLTEVGASFQWNPFSEYMQTATEKIPIKDGYPQFAFQVSQSLPNVLDGDFNFTKFNFRAFYAKKARNGTSTEILINSGLSFGDIPLTHLYHTSPNQPDGLGILDRFSVTGRESFETMFFDEFFSDRYIMGQIKHSLRPFKISTRIRPRLSLITRSVIGNVADVDRHVGLSFDALNKGYFESGMELNRIFAGFGLSFFYRHGAYHLPTFDDNISFKFTYYFNLGF